MKNQIDESVLKRNIIDEFINVLEKSKSIGIDISKITTTDTIASLANKSSVGKDKLRRFIWLTGLDENYQIGRIKDQIVQAYRGNNSCIPPTEEQEKN